MTRYVAGFLIDQSAHQVVLVRKKRPGWQAGRLNGVGGHIETTCTRHDHINSSHDLDCYERLGEDPREAMRREFREEATLDFQWLSHFATIQGPWGSVAFFRAFTSLKMYAPTALTRTDEPIEFWDYRDPALYEQAIPNLSWLIPLALYTHDRYEPVVASEAVTDHG